MSLKGTLNTVSLAGVFQMLCDNRVTGILRVSGKKGEYQIYLLEGSIIYAVESTKEYRLGELLIIDEIISRDQLNNSLKEAKKMRVALGKILIEKKTISKETLKKYIFLQVEEIFFNIFRWEDGDFEYNDSKLILRWLSVIKLNTMGLILSASRRIDKLSEIDNT